jgi:hypothetical protein
VLRLFVEEEQELDSSRSQTSYEPGDEEERVQAEAENAVEEDRMASFADVWLLRGVGARWSFRGGVEEWFFGL